MPFGVGLTRQAASPSRAIIEQTADWLVTLESRDLSEAEKTELTAWRKQSPQHEQAWQAALRLKGMIDNMPDELGKQVWGRERVDRRAALKALAGVAVLVPASKLAWDQWPALTADYRTATGEQRTVTLPDGSQLQLNTATLVKLRFSASERLIELIDGEILVTTAQLSVKSRQSATGKRPFIVQTRAGRIRALGTRFSLRNTKDGTTHVRVYEHAVAIQPALVLSETHIEAGKAVNFDRQRTATAKALHQPVPAWTRGQIISDNQRLDNFIAELARYRPGILRCDPAVADLRISGVFQLNNTDQALDILASTLPVRISRATDYWVTVTGK